MRRKPKKRNRGQCRSAFGIRPLGIESLEDRQMLACDLLAAPGLMGDLNFDSGVNSTDLGLMLNHYGETENTSYCSGDLNVDGSIDSVDLGLLLNHFEQSLATSAFVVPEPPEVPPVDDHANQIGADATQLDFSFSNGEYLTTAFGVLDYDGDVDVFQFTTDTELPASGFAIPFTSGLITAELLDADGNLLATTAGGIEAGHAGFNATLPAGTYYLSVSDVADATIGFYFVSLTLGEFVPPPVVDDHVDTIGSDATPLLFNNARTDFLGELLSDDDNVDVDVFQFTNEANNPFALNSLILLDGQIQVELVDADGVRIASASSNEFNQLTLSEPDLPAGLYYVIVSGSEANGGFYVMSAELGTPEIPDDHADTIGDSATPIQWFPRRQAQAANAFGLLETIGDVDVFQFTATSDLPFSAQISTGSFRKDQLELLDSDGNSIGIVMSERNESALLTADLVAGSYYLKVSNLESDIGHFELDLLLGEFGDDHVNEIGADATVISFDGDPTGTRHSFQNGYLESNTDVDVFQFIVEQVSDFHGLVFALGPDAVTVNLISAETGEVLNSETDFFFTADFSGQLQAGSYYLTVAASELSGFATDGEYHIDLQLTPANPTDDHANQIGADATEIGLSGFNGALRGTANGRLSNPADVDVFQFAIAEDLPVQISPLGSPDGLNAQLLDPSGTIIASTDDGIGSLNMDLAAGTYFVSVDQTDANPFQPSMVYSIEVIAGTVGATDDHGDRLDDSATLIDLSGLAIGTPAGMPVIGDIEEMGDIDVFRFTAEIETTLLIHNVPFSPGITYELLSSDGTLIGTGTDASVGEATVSPGDYFLRISATDFSIGFYFLHFEAVAVNTEA